jgi:hypothetical protein
MERRQPARDPIIRILSALYRASRHTSSHTAAAHPVYAVHRCTAVTPASTPPSTETSVSCISGADARPPPSTCSEKGTGSQERGGGEGEASARWRNEAGGASPPIVSKSKHVPARWGSPLRTSAHWRLLQFVSKFALVVLRGSAKTPCPRSALSNVSSLLSRRSPGRSGRV